MPRHLFAAAVVILLAVAAFGRITPGPPVTDATLVARLERIPSPPDNLALAEYYRAKAKAEEPRIEFTDHLFRAYMQLEGKAWEPAREQARKLLRAARESKKRYELLAAAHTTLAYDTADDSGGVAPPTPHR